MRPGPPGMMQQRPPTPHGLMQIPNSAPPIPGMPDMLRPPMQQLPHPPLDLAPPVTKKLRSDAEDLIPEQEFISKNPVCNTAWGRYSQGSSPQGRGCPLSIERFVKEEIYVVNGMYRSL